ncbi:hypothetical protein V8E36_007758 [Tilletia maclaganii]
MEAGGGGGGGVAARQSKSWVVFKSSRVLLASTAGNRDAFDQVGEQSLDPVLGVYETGRKDEAGERARTPLDLDVPVRVVGIDVLLAVDARVAPADGADVHDCVNGSVAFELGFVPVGHDFALDRVSHVLVRFGDVASRGVDFLQLVPLESGGNGGFGRHVCQEGDGRKRRAQCRSHAEQRFSEEPKERKPWKLSHHLNCETGRFMRQRPALGGSIRPGSHVSVALVRCTPAGLPTRVDTVQLRSCRVESVYLISPAEATVN